MPADRGASRPGPRRILTSPEALGRALRRPGDPPVELRETHLSWVLLTADRAYKLRKPVHHAFVDQTTPPQRRRLTEEEARINAPLAPGLVLGVRAVLERDGALALGPADAPGAVDWVVEMRRFDEARTLDARVRAGTATSADIDAVAARLAAFHNAADRVAVADPVARVRAMCDRNADELRAAAGGVLPAAELRAAARAAAAFVSAHHDELVDRAASGRVVDGHGDLRAEHVVLEDDGVLVVDRLEFDRDLRIVDVADDVAFLVMELSELGADDLAAWLVDAYRDAGGDPGGDELVAFFAAYRALVRAKVAVLRAGDLDGADRDAQRSRARALLALATRFAWRARGPLLLLVTGPPGSGKSTLAAALAAASGFPVLSSDRERKRALGLEADDPAPASAYGDAARADVYRRLAAAARDRLEVGGVIVDATFGDEALQSAFLAALPRPAHAAIRVVRCAPDPQTTAARVRARTPRDAAGSDAGPAVAARLAAESTPFPAPAERQLALDTGEEPAELAERVAAWLDEEPGGG